MKRRPAPHPFAFLLVLLAGCGGGGSSPSESPSPPGAKGTARVSIAWPTRNGRFVPLAANSVVVALTLNGTTVRQTLARQGDGASVGTANFIGLAYGTYAVRTDAYPTTDGTGVAQATGRGTMKVVEDVPGKATVSLTTTVKTVSLLPTAFDKGQSATLSLAARDAAGATVLLDSGGLEQTAWTLGAPNVLSVVGDAKGPSLTVKGIHSGSSTVDAAITLGDRTFKAAATVTVNVINDGSGTVTVS